MEICPSPPFPGELGVNVHLSHLRYKDEADGEASESWRFDVNQSSAFDRKHRSFNVKIHLSFDLQLQLK